MEEARPSLGARGQVRWRVRNVVLVVARRTPPIFKYTISLLLLGEDETAAADEEEDMKCQKEKNNQPRLTPTSFRGQSMSPPFIHRIPHSHKADTLP